MSNDKRLFLLDAMALIYRSYFAFQRNPRINSKGMNTSAVLGFTNTLLDVIRNESPTHLGVAFDTSAPTMRHEGFADYKANRESMPEELAASIPYIKEVLKAFRIPMLLADGFEADDVIGTLAKKAEAQGFTTFMMTPDKDFGQLVSDHIFMYKPGKAGEAPSTMGPREICEKYGIERPEQLIDILGLWGDASDNIPGVPGIGEKWAIRLIGEYGSVENLILHSADLKGKMRENLENFSQQALMSKELATIQLDAPVDFNPGELILASPDEASLRSLFEELEFRTLARRVFDSGKAEVPADEQVPPSPAPAAPPDLFSDPAANLFSSETGLNGIEDTEHEYMSAFTAEDRTKLIDYLGQFPSFCFDTETTGLDPHVAELVGIAFAAEKGRAWFVHLPDDRIETLGILEEFRDLFEDEGKGKTGQNIKYDITVLSWYGIDVKGPLFDTMIAHYLLEPDMRHNMDYLAEAYLAYRTIPIENLIGKKGRNQMSMRMVNPETIRDYACEDADITLQLREHFEPLLAEAGAAALFTETEMPLVKVLAHMEMAGIRLDTEALNEYSVLLGREILMVEKEIYELAGTEFNIASPKQLGEILYERLKVTDKPRRTKTRQYATSEDVLIRLLNRHPIVGRILDYRSLTKLKSTYVDTLPAMVSKRTGLIHTSYNQAVAATGRLSSNNPNLQNIPIRTERGREIRKAFIPRDNEHILLAADYSQIELRLIAELSGDQAMLDDFARGRDIHAATAARVYNVAVEDVDRDMRRNAKTVNFGIIYGISAFGLAERLDIPRTEAADIIRSYFREYPGIRIYMDACIASAREKGYVETIKGRRRYLRDINSSNSVVRGFAERNAINAPIQGSSADMIKIAMIRIQTEMKQRGLQSLPVLQVHDELVFDAVRSELPVMLELVPRLMREAIVLKVPVEVDVSTGENWLEAH